MAVVLDALKNMVARSMRMAVRRAPRPIPAESLSRHRRRSVFYAEGGFSTVGMVFALLVTLSLIFTTAQVYEIETTSSHVQNVADAAALAAENEVAEFSIVVRLCDALVLTMSLTGIATMGLGIAALCTPATAPLADKLIKAATDVIDARNTFARRAASGLNRFQAFLPFLAAANAASIVQANSDVSAGTGYFGFAVVLPIEGDAIEVGSLDSAKELANSVEENEARIKEAAEAAEEASGEAKAEKEKAFMADCGNDPGYCMYERAGHLAGLSAKDNPLYRSVDTWSFSVALKRAQAYYPARLAQEAPEGASVEEQARSALRTRYYRFAVEEIGKGYVREDEDSFEARFPLLPKNTEQMRRTDLFTEAVYPVTIDSEGGAVMHAWAGCPGVSGGQAAGAGSLAQMEAGRFVTCSACGFTAASLGKVASASTSIDNGFEYHYNIVAEAADAYQKAREKARPYAEEVKTLTKDLLDDVDGALFDAMSYRIESQPPGRYGAVAFAADLADVSAATRFPSAFVKGNASVGARAAVSAAALASDDPSEGETVITALLDNVEADVAGGAAMPLGIVLDLWSALLACYAGGMESLERGIESALSQMPLASESGLGTWAANAFSDAVGSLGLSPAELDSPKPVLVNTAHVLASDASGFSSALLKAKEDCVALGDAAGADLFTTALSVFESSSLEALDGFERGIEIAVIEPFGEAGPSIPLTLALPPAVTSIAGRAVQGSIDKMRAVYAQAGGVRRWE